MNDRRSTGEETADKLRLWYARVFVRLCDFVCLLCCLLFLLPGPLYILQLLVLSGIVSLASLKENGHGSTLATMTSSPPKKPKKEAPQKSNTELEEVKQEVPPTAASEEPTTEVATEELEPKKNIRPRKGRKKVLGADDADNVEAEALTPEKRTRNGKTNSMSSTKQL